MRSVLLIITPDWLHAVSFFRNVYGKLSDNQFGSIYLHYKFTVMYMDTVIYRQNDTIKKRSPL